MKHLTLLINLLIVPLFFWGQAVVPPSIKLLNAPDSVGKFEKYEIDIEVKNFTGNNYNPDEINIYGIFYKDQHPIIPKKTVLHNINAFYLKDYKYSCSALPDGGHDYGNSQFEDTFYYNNTRANWKIRFTPNFIGKWEFRIFYSINGSKSKLITNGEGFFTCTENSNKGFIKVANNKKYLEYSDHTPIYLIGENMEEANHSNYTISNKEIGAGCSSRWGGIVDPLKYKHGGICMFNKWIEELTNSGGNYIRLTSDNIMADNSDLLNLNINQEKAFRFDKYFDILNNQNIKFKFLITKKKIIKDCDFFNTSSADYTNFKYFLRYMIARYGYNTNMISWEIIDEVNFPSQSTQNCVDSLPDSVINWFSEVKGYIKELDKNHLVSSGGISWGNEIDTFTYAVTSMMDLVEIHSSSTFKYMYGNNQKFDPNTAEYDICEIPYDSYKLPIERKCFFSDIIIKNNKLQKPVFINSFWLVNAAGSRSHHFVDPKGFYIHNALWHSIFSGSLASATPFYWSENIHPGYYRKPGYYNNPRGSIIEGIFYPDNGAYCTNDFSDNPFDYNPGQLNHFKQIKELTDKIDFSEDYSSISNYNVSNDSNLNNSINVIITNGGIIANGLRKNNKTHFFGRVQDTLYTYENITKNYCEYLKTFDYSNKPTIISNASINLEVDSANSTYQITWYNINHDNLSINQVDATFSDSNKKVTFNVPPLKGNYGDLAFEIKKVTKNEHTAGFTINKMHDTHINIVKNLAIKLDAYETYPDENDYYFIYIREADSLGNVLPNTTGIKYVSQNIPRNLDLRAVCSSFNYNLNLGHYYKIRFAVCNPWNAISKWIYMADNASPSFKVKNICGDWSDNTLHHVNVGEKTGTSLLIDASETNCTNKYEIIVQECDKWWNVYNFCKSWAKWYNGKPDIIDIQQLMDNEYDGLTLKGGYLENGLERYYKIQLVTNEPNNNWTPYTILIKKDDCPETMSKSENNGVSSNIFDQTKKELLLFPNPSSSILNIKLDNYNNEYVRIFNSNGKLIKNIQLKNKVQIDISDYPRGIYYIELLRNNNIIREKFIKI